MYNVRIHFSPTVQFPFLQYTLWCKFLRTWCTVCAELCYKCVIKTAVYRGTHLTCTTSVCWGLLWHPSWCRLEEFHLIEKLGWKRQVYPLVTIRLQVGTTEGAMPKYLGGPKCQIPPSTSSPLPSHLPFLHLFPLPFLPLNTAKEFGGALLAPPVGSGAEPRHRLGTCEALRFDSNSNRPSDSIRFDSKGTGRFENFLIKSAMPAPLLIASLVEQLKPLTALSETINIHTR